MSENSKISAFRAEFPVLRDYAYLNAGTEGPIPQSAADAVRERLAIDLAHGRVGASYFEAVLALRWPKREPGTPRYSEPSRLRWHSRVPPPAESTQS